MRYKKIIMKCDTCGRFISYKEKFSWANIFSLSFNFGIDDIIFRCEKCTCKYTPVQSNSKIKSDYYQGINEVDNL